MTKVIYSKKKRDETRNLHLTNKTKCRPGKPCDLNFRMETVFPPGKYNEFYFL